MKSKGRFLALLLCSLVLAGFYSLMQINGCASIIHGTKQEIGFTSNPTGALVTIDNIPVGNTPIIKKLKRGRSHIVEIKMEGYQPFSATITKDVSGWVWGNIIFGGLIGLAIDAISGGMYELNPEQIYATLGKSGTSLLLDDDMICIAVVLNPDPTWTKIGSLQRN